MPDLEPIIVLAEIGTAIGTFCLAAVTYKTLREMQRCAPPTLKINVAEGDIGSLNEWGDYMRPLKYSGLAIGFRAINTGKIPVTIEHLNFG